MKWIDLSVLVFLSLLPIFCFGIYSPTESPNGYNTDLKVQDNGANIIIDQSNKTGAPLLNAQFQPIWTETQKSICIDNGDPRILDTCDGTPSDIGAHPTVSHIYETYEMPYFVSGSREHNGLKWMSFPVLDKYTTNNVNQTFFSPIINPTKLEWVKYKPLGEDYEHTMHWANNTLYFGTDIANSIQGYKVQLQNTVNEPIMVNASGFQQDPLTEIELSDGENWLGYFLTESTQPLVVLADILDVLIEIKTQYWSITKQDDGTWIGEKNPVFNYGDMVVLNSKNPNGASFHWGTDQNVPPEKKPLSKEFIYIEKEDYTPVYVRIPATKNGEIPTEIGLYVNDLCKGAVVVKDSIAQICAYLDEDEEITPENSELVFYYESKSAPNNMGIYHLSDKSFTHAEVNSSYYLINISNLNDVIPVVKETALAQNYPNPFNPSTTISYQLPKDGKVNLAIYNVKGQVVKSLVNENKSLGKHSVVWNGKDDSGNACASGVYLYKLKTGDASITRKMMLLK